MANALRLYKPKKEAFIDQIIKLTLKSKMQSSNNENRFVLIVKILHLPFPFHLRFKIKPSFKGLIGHQSKIIPTCCQITKKKCCAFLSDE